MIDRNALGEALAIIERRKREKGGSVIAASSSRTPKSLCDWLRNWAEARSNALVSDFPRFSALLASCDEFFVTADSVSMLSECILTGRPVGMIPISLSLRGRLSHALTRMKLKPPPRMDLRKFWALLEREQLVGTPSLPRASQACDTTERAAGAIRNLFETDAAPNPASVRKSQRAEQGDAFCSGSTAPTATTG